MLRQNRALWVFGFLFALAGGESGMRLFNGSGSGRDGSSSGGPNTGQFPNFHMPTVDWAAVAWIAVVAVVALILLAIIGLIVRYVAETALMKGVEEIESTGATLTVKHGFQLGWSRQALQLFVTDLLIYVPLALAAIVLIGIAALPLLFWLTHIVPLGILASLVSVALGLLVILSLIVVGLVLSIIMPYIRRKVVLDKQGVVAAVRESAQLARTTLVDTGLMWLLLAGLRIVWSLVMIPVAIIVVLVAVVIGGIPAGLVYLVSQSWIAAVIIGGVLFLLVLVPITAFAEGLFDAYVSASWTLTYRELLGKAVTPPVVAPTPMLPETPMAPQSPLATA